MRMLTSTAIEERKTPLSIATPLSVNLKTAVGGEVFLTQSRREAENAEEIANLRF